MSKVEIALLFILLCVLGLCVDLIVTKLHFLLSKTHFKEHHFSWSRYISMIIPLLLAVIFIVFAAGLSPLWVFLGFAVMGTAMEWLMGYAYYHIIGQRLWTYHRYALSGYTSLLVMPLWGLAGLIFWVIASAVHR